MRESVIRWLRRTSIIEPLWNRFDRRRAARGSASGRDAAPLAPAAMMLGIPEIREILLEQGDHSHTSIKFQDSLLQFIRDNAELGGSVIEVGCYRGGLTTQLARTCREFGKALFVIDVNAEHLDIAKRNVDRLAPGGAPTWFVGDLESFMNQQGNRIAKPLVIFIDGDHTYVGVVKDIKAILTNSNAPHALIFHDFGLRYIVGGMVYPDVRVDLAILDCFGRDIRMEPIGEVSFSARREDDGPYFEAGLPEGVIVLYSAIADSVKSHEGASMRA